MSSFHSITLNDFSVDLSIDKSSHDNIIQWKLTSVFDPWNKNIHDDFTTSIEGIYDIQTFSSTYHLHNQCAIATILFTTSTNNKYIECKLTICDDDTDHDDIHHFKNYTVLKFNYNIN
jgi:hypothetical protein